MDVGSFLRKLFGEPARGANIFLFGPNITSCISLASSRGSGGSAVCVCSESWVSKKGWSGGAVSVNSCGPVRG